MKKIKQQNRTTGMFGKPVNVHKTGPTLSPEAMEGAEVGPSSVASAIGEMSEENQKAANVYFSTMQQMSQRISMQLFGRHGREVDALKVIDGVTSDINEMVITKLPKSTVPEMAAIFAGAVGAAVGVAVGMDKSGKLLEGLSPDMFEAMGAMFGMGARLTAESIIERQQNKVQLVKPAGFTH